MVNTADERVTVLLGAGASVDAGIPASVDLTRRIAEAIDSPINQYRGLARALHIAIGAMVAHDTARGGAPYAGIDVERIFAAVRMLARREDLEIAPFVGAWNPNLESIGPEPSLPGFWGRDFVEAAASERNSHRLESLVKEAVLAFSGKGRERTNVFADLEKWMIDALQDALRVEASRVDYLGPILANSGSTVNVATLNYDKSIELLAERAGASLDTGVRSWSGGYDWRWDPAARVRLLKLHGSLDWYLEREKGTLMETDRVVIWPDGDTKRPFYGSLAVVFGQGVKLRSDGPFLAMLHEFDSFLSSTDRLVIAGYSMRDDHINAAIRRWLNRHPDPKLTIIDPFPPAIRGTSTFYGELLYAMRDHAHPGDPNGALKDGHQILQMFAPQGLHEVFGPGPELSQAAQVVQEDDDVLDDPKIESPHAFLRRISAEPGKA
jgi:hypothetical protein